MIQVQRQPVCLDPYHQTLLCKLLVFNISTIKMIMLNDLKTDSLSICMYFQQHSVVKSTFKVEFLSDKMELFKMDFFLSKYLYSARTH